jgi:hypothetical protein
MHKKKTFALLALLALLTSLFQAVPAAVAAEDAASDESEEANIYEWQNSTSFGGNWEWVRYDPEGEPHSYNTDPDNAWFIPEGASRELPHPYGASTKVRNTGDDLIHEWYNASSYAWVEYDPDGGAHPYNTAENNCPDYALEWANPWNAQTRTRSRSAPEAGPGIDPSTDPVGALIEGYLSVADLWIDSGWHFLMKIIGREDMADDAISLTDEYNKYMDPDGQP